MGGRTAQAARLRKIRLWILRKSKGCLTEVIILGEGQRFPALSPAHEASISQWRLASSEGDAKPTERRKKMETQKSLMIVVAWMCLASIVFPAWGLNPQPEPPRPEKLVLPKGTTVEKIGEGHFKFKLPDGRTVEVKGFQRGSGGTATLSECRIYDSKGKLTTLGKQGTLKGGPKVAEGKVEYLKIDAKKFVKIDDEPTWLPATIQFQKITKGTEFPK